MYRDLRTIGYAALVMASLLCAGSLAAVTSGSTGATAPTGSPTKWFVGANTPPAGTVAPGATQYPCLQFDIQRYSNATTSSGLIYFSVNQVGTLGTFWISRYELWLDGNRDGKLDASDSLLMQSTDGQFYNAPFTPGYAPPAGTTLIMPPVQPGQTVSLLVTVDVDPQAPVGDTIQFMCTSNPNLGLPYLMFDPVLNFAPSITWNGHLIGGLFSEEQTVDAPQPPSFTPATAPDATVGVPYDLAFKVIGGQAPFNWSLFSGTLPPGLSLVPAATSDEMHLSGTPAAAGTYSFEVHLVDDGGYNVTNSYTLLVNTAPAGPGDQVTTGKPTGGGCAAAGGAAWPVLLALLLPLAVLRRRRRA